jgi:hypothetical protein
VVTADGTDRDRPLILHCFADEGTECEALAVYGDVIRVGIDPNDTNESQPIRADAHLEADGKDWELPIRDQVSFDLGVFHPVCSRWAETTSISGNPDEHQNMIPSARRLAQQYCKHSIIENVPKAPLEDPVLLEGKMFGLPIQYRRAFETTFPVPQPPVHKRYWLEEGQGKKAETSSFFFSERSKTWWASTKQYRPEPYSKQHLAKNCIPAPYIHHLCRSWLKVYEDEEGISEGRVDYSNYDQQKTAERNEDAHRTLDEFAPDPEDNDSTS